MVCSMQILDEPAVTFQSESLYFDLPEGVEAQLLDPKAMRTHCVEQLAAQSGRFQRVSSVDSGCSDGCAFSLSDPHLLDFMYDASLAMVPGCAQNFDRLLPLAAGCDGNGDDEAELLRLTEDLACYLGDDGDDEVGLLQAAAGWHAPQAAPSEPPCAPSPAAKRSLKIKLRCPTPAPVPAEPVTEGTAGCAASTPLKRKAAAALPPDKRAALDAPLSPHSSHSEPSCGSAGSPCVRPPAAPSVARSDSDGSHATAALPAGCSGDKSLREARARCESGGEEGDGTASAPLRGKRSCMNCDSSVTPQWRVGPLGPGTLCNACGVRHKKGHLLKGVARKFPGRYPARRA